MPYAIIKNRDISHRAIYLYSMLQTLADDGIVMDIGCKIMEVLGWKDYRSLNSNLLEIQENGLIEGFTKISKKSFLRIQMLPVNFNYVGIQEDDLYRVIESGKAITLKDRIADFKELVLRLFLYIEMFYNENKKESYPTYRQIMEDTKMGEHEITAVINKFESEGLMNIKRGNKWVNTEKGMKLTANGYVPLINGRDSTISPPH